MPRLGLDCPESMTEMSCGFSIGSLTQKLCTHIGGWKKKRQKKKKKNKKINKSNLH